MDHTTVLYRMRKFFESGATRTCSFRREQLKKLKNSILQHENELYDAMKADLNKSPEETWITENGMVIAEINAALRGLNAWMEPESVPTNLLNLPSRSRIIREPLGVVLVIGPWNYPFQLLVNPVVGAIAAGNCVVMKPSEVAGATAKVIHKIFETTFPTEYIYVIEGEGEKLIPPMMNNFRFDHVFFTGSQGVGKQIYKLAAEKLVPVTLELGGKSPCVVEADANVQVAARRIAVTKFSNAGQMCVAPDYVLVHQTIKKAFLDSLAATIKKFYGEKAEDCYNFGRIINEKQFDRLEKYLTQGEIYLGGKRQREKLFIEPTILTNLSPEAAVMSEEIFGPILPVIGFKEKQEAKTIIQQHPDPLSFYIYTTSLDNEKYWLDAVPSGGACVNNSSWHLTNYHLPFGGRGGSGSGNYHGRYSFETFSHRKAVMKTPNWFDPGIKYPPFKGKLKLFKKVLR